MDTHATIPVFPWARHAIAEVSKKLTPVHPGFADDQVLVLAFWRQLQDIEDVNL